MLKEVFLLVALVSTLTVHGDVGDDEKLNGSCDPGDDDPCDDDGNMQCSGGRCQCNDNFYAEVGSDVCELKRPGYGQTCNVAGQSAIVPCGPYLTCEGTCKRNNGQWCAVDGECMTGSQCKRDASGQKKCTARNKLYGSCTSGSCANGGNMQCISGICQCTSTYYASTGTDVCLNTPRRRAGEVCVGLDSECEANTACMPQDDGRMKCTRVGELYGTCTGSCDAQLACVFGVCQCAPDFYAARGADKCLLTPRKRIGASCEGLQNECEVGSHCLPKTGGNSPQACNVDGQLYGYCSIASDCLSNGNLDCINNVCVCKSTHYALTTEATTCAEERNGFMDSCDEDVPRACIENYKCVDYGVTERCMPGSDGAGFLKASVTSVVLAVMISAWPRG